MSANRVLPLLVWICGGILVLSPIVVVVIAGFGDTTYLSFPPKGFSFSAYRTFISSSDWRSSFLHSILLATVTGVTCPVVAVTLTLAFARAGRIIRTAIVASQVAAMLLPPTILAVGLATVAGRVKIVDSYVPLVIGHLVLAAPLCAVLGIDLTRRDGSKLDAVALSLGSPPSLVMVRIILPRLRSFIFLCAFFGFVTSFDELVMASYLSGTHTQTLPVRLWAALRYDMEPAAGVVAAIMLSLSIVAPALLLRTTETFGETE